MSKTITALLLALSLATVACDDGDDKTIERNDTGDESTTGDDEETTTDTTPEVETTTSGGTTDDDKNPGCFNAAFELPPTGGPNGTLGDKC